MNINDNNNQSDKTIQIVEELVAAGIIKDRTDTNEEREFDAQDFDDMIFAAQDIVVDVLNDFEAKEILAELEEKKPSKQDFLGVVETKFIPAKNPREFAVRSSIDAEKVLREIVGDDMQVRQKLVALYLNKANKIMCADVLTIGTSTQVLMDNRMIAKQALAVGAEAVIIGHNHPSGNERPSEADKRSTGKLKIALGGLDISLLDNIILTDKTKYSFADNGERSLA